MCGGGEKRDWWIFNRIFVQPAESLTFPDEDTAVIVLEEFSFVLSVSVAYDLHAVLDDHQYEQLLFSSSIQKQAHLTTLSYSSGTSSRWL